MIAQQLLPILVAAILANLAIMALVVVPPLLGRRGPLATQDRGGRAEADRTLDAAAVIGGILGGRAGFAGGMPYDRVVSTVSWNFLAATAVIVTVSGQWSEQRPAILGLVAIGALFVLVIHELAPAESLGGIKYVLEGSVAITFVTLLVLLTGGHASPFAPLFPLIVGGSAIVIEGPVLIALAGAASIGYLAAALIGGGGPTPLGIAAIGIELSVLVLFAYVGSVIGREQRRTRDAAVRLSTTDSLTGLFNRAFVIAALDREIARSRRSRRAFCLLMIDLDGLKALNDQHGHHVGDAVIRTVAETLREGVRTIDVAARIGGDEFVALLPETDPTGGWVLGEKIREATASRVIPGTTVRASVSIGVVAFPADGTTGQALLIAADRAMYAAKAGGRDRVVLGSGHRFGAQRTGPSDDSIVPPASGSREESVTAVGRDARDV